MAYHQQQGQGRPTLSATFVPGGYDDFYMPAPGPELVAPAPQKHMPQMPEQIQSGLANMELQDSSRHSYSYPAPQPQQQQLQQQQNMQAYSYAQSPPSIPAPSVHSPSQNKYDSFGHIDSIPNFSPFPKINPRPPNVPPSDDEKEEILESARLPVLNSNDPEMQLAWAQDALSYCACSASQEERLSENNPSRPARPATPAIEHQLRTDAMNIVTFLAEQNHPKAAFIKGMWLEFGNFGVRQDKREAFRCYARASERGYSRAEYRMGMQFEQGNDPIKALVHYQRGAAAGDSASNYRLGMMTLMGQMGQAQDYGKGLQMLRIAAECADENAPQGAYVLGMLQARELPQVTVPEVLLPYNLQEARQNIEKAAYLGFAKAQLKMGSAYELCALSCEFNPALSLHYNALAARQGEPEAEMAISKWFLCGHENVFPKNEALAYEYAERAAQSGLATAEFALGYFNEIGVHVSVNIEKAKYWYDLAAKNGNQDAVGRLESLNSSGQQLSKKDHENIAISRIKSQHGSMRGKRPERLRAQQPNLSSMAEEEERPSGAAVIPPRGSSITPYPVEDGPPKVAAASKRPPTVAPYPEDNGPPKLGGGPGGFAGGFAPELRSHSAAPATMRHSSGPAFNINPNIYNDQGGAPQGNGYGQRPVSHYPGQGGYNQAPPQQGRPPQRPATSMSEPQPGGYGRGSLPSQQGYGGAPQRLSPNARPQPGPSPGMQEDIGYVAPLQPKKQSLLDQTSPAGAAYRPPRTDSARPPPPQQQQQAAPSSAKQQQQQQRPPPGKDTRKQGLPSNPAPPSKQNTVPVPAKANSQPAAPVKVPAKTNSAPAPAAGGLKPPGSRPPGKGPKTFDEMGVAAGKEQGDCIVM